MFSKQISRLRDCLSEYRKGNLSQEETSLLLENTMLEVKDLLELIDE